MVSDVGAVTGMWQQLKQALLDLLFPPRCVGCRRPDTWLCPECQKGIERIAGPVCRRCGRPVAQSDRLCSSCGGTADPIDGIRSVAYFEGVLREAIHRFKYRGGQALAQPLGQLMVEHWSECEIPAEMLIPVPLHPTRLGERGYNHAALLARELSAKVGLPVEARCLARVRATPLQVNLDAAARRENVRGAFRCLDDRVAGRSVVLIDDVCTTGATLTACGAALREAGVASVWGYTLARAR